MGALRDLQAASEIQKFAQIAALLQGRGEATDELADLDHKHQLALASLRGQLQRDTRSELDQHRAVLAADGCDGRPMPDGSSPRCGAGVGGALAALGALALVVVAPELLLLGEEGAVAAEGLAGAGLGEAAAAEDLAALEGEMALARAAGEEGLVDRVELMRLQPFAAAEAAEEVSMAEQFTARRSYLETLVRRSDDRAASAAEYPGRNAAVGC